MSVAGEAIYVLTEFAIGGNKRKVVDVYSKEAGSYSYSSEVPESSDRIFFTEGFVYTVSGATVTKWQTQM